MLSTNSTSSIQKRRQLHRRQQSLEVPTLDTLPANPRRKPITQGHRRGLSLDQSLSNLNSPTGFRPLRPQDNDQDQFQGPSPVRIQLDTTNLGHPPDQQQHFIKQETQQHRPAQPGYLAQDFSTHLQQQLNGNVNTNIVAPTPQHPTQEQALNALQTHLEWYQQNFGHSPSPNPIMQNNTTYAINQQIVTDLNGIDAAQPYGVAMPQTPVSHGHPHTVPNTPQQFARNWPSPPATDMKHARSQSFQCDVAPMHPVSFESALPVRTSPFQQASTNFIEQFEAAAEAHGYQGYASSAYSSSNVDPMSPSQQYNGGPMPTLFEEDPSIGAHIHSNGLPEDALLFQAAAGAPHDFNSPNFVVGGGISPHTAMLNELEDIECTVIDTGIPTEEIERHIREVDGDSSGTKTWYCLYELAGGKACGKTFKRTENARSHVQNHLGDRQFLCNVCGKTFVRQHDMKRHSAIHKDDRPHVCPCEAKFARHDALTRHRQRGMCAGTLPGYEKTDEEKPKRGRPKKERPDQKTRIDKAKKARQMDRANDNDSGPLAELNFASPSSDEHSLPMTPPDHSDFDADAFINMGNTPPTSPPPKTISPNMLTVGAMPDVPHDFTSYGSPFDSTMASSPFGGDDDDVLEIRPMKWAEEKDFSMFDPTVFERDSNLASVLGSWIANH